MDITDFAVQDNTPFNHIAVVSDDIINISIERDDLNKVIEEISEDIGTNNDKEYELYEVKGEVSIPSIPFDDDPSKGSTFLSAIMKRLYNSSSTICVLHNPKPDECPKYILCAPYTRVNASMHKEIIETFTVVCKNSNIEYEYKPFKLGGIDVLPLTWNIIPYRDGSEIDIAMAFDDLPPRIMSTHLSEQPLATKIKMSATQAKKAAIIDSILMHSRMDIKGHKAIAQELLPMISRDRSRDMSYFISMGRCLYRIFNGDSQGLDLWAKWCIPEMRQSCDEYWPILDTSCTYYSVNTLQYWASTDSPKQYQEWNSLSVRSALESSVMATGGVLDIAEAAYRKNPILFICEGDDSREATFYQFNGTYYKQCGIFALQDYIERTLISEYEDFLKDMSKLADANPENNFKEMMQKKIDICIKIIKSLKDDAFQMKVVKILMRRYNKVGFDNIRDANPNLTAFEDCVFDAERKTIRAGMPEDYITCSTGYTFLDEWNTYNWEHPDVKTVLENKDKLIHDPEKRELLDREEASFLHASNPLKRKIITYGPTNNGKSIYYAYIGKTLGSIYCPDVPSNTLYAQEIHPGTATPHLEAARFARLLLQMEITDEHILNEALVKRFTGCMDKITYRGLYKRCIKAFVPTCKPHTVCNTLPRINGNSAALRTRIIVITLDSKFITEKDPEYEVIKDMDTEARDKHMKEHHWYWANTQFDSILNSTYKAFMWIMIQNYIKYSKPHMDKDGKMVNSVVPMQKIPKSVLKDTSEYFVKSNLFLQFLKAATKKAEGPSAGVTTYSLYNAFKKWYKDNVSPFACVPFSKFLEELSSMSFKAHNDMFYNIVITYQ